MCAAYTAQTTEAGVSPLLNGTPWLQSRSDIDTSGNRFEPVENGQNFDRISELHLNHTLLDWDEVHHCFIPEFLRAMLINFMTDCNFDISISVPHIIVSVNEPNSEHIEADI